MASKLPPEQLGPTLDFVDFGNGRYAANLKYIA